MLVAGSDSSFLQQSFQRSTGLLTAGLQQRLPGNQKALIAGFDICDQIPQGGPEQPFGPVSLNRIADRCACCYRKSRNRTVPSFDYQNKERVDI